VLELNGAKARVADAGVTGNSALTGLASVSDFFSLQNAAKVSTTGNLSIIGSGAIAVDGQDIGGGGGSSLTIGGKLTNTSTNNDGIDIGDTGITSADTLTVNGTGGLSNTGRINITGSAAVQATLNVANAAAGFGTKGVESGTVILTNDALLEFKSGEITTINGVLELNGAKARVADAGVTGNSALTGLATVSDFFSLQNAAKVSTTGNLSIIGSGAIAVDGQDIGGGGGSSLTIGGTLTNTSTNPNGIDIGDSGITATDTLTVEGKGGLSNTGQINITGSASTTAKLVVANTATSSGTIVIGYFPGSLGDLTAATVNITGGLLEGFGTVTGALHVTGGTVVGGSQNSTPGTLSVNGSYSQSGSGRLQAESIPRTRRNRALSA
jgi:hypothetical protein